MRIPRPSHATIVAYLALFAALSGSAYAVSKIGTNDLKRSAVTSPKIKKKTIKGTDVRNDGLGGKQINESTLNLSKASRSEQAQGGVCEVTAGITRFCATTNDLKVRGGGTRIFATAYGTYSGGGPGSSAICRIEGTGGGSQSVALRGTGADGFSVSAAGQFDVGARKLSLVCVGNTGAATIDDPHIVVLGL
jgi:hypothetical protein